MKKLYNYNEVVLNILKYYETFEVIYTMRFKQYDHVTECNVYDESAIYSNTLAKIQIFDFDNDKTNLSYIAVDITACSSNDHDYDIIDILHVVTLNDTLYGESQLTGELIKLN